MRICLIQPRYESRRYFVTIPNIGLGYLGAALKSRFSCDVTIIDCLIEKLDEHGLVALISEHKPDVVGISFYSPDYAPVRGCVRALDNLRPRPIVALGGPHPTFEPEATLREFPGADILFLGESEKSFPAFISDLEKGAGVASQGGRPGTAIRDGDEIIKGGAAPAVDVNITPIPAWDLIRPERYPTAPNGIFSKRKKIAPMIATRGCPYNCAYCAVGRMLGHALRARDAENVMEEIRLLLSRGVQEIHFMDDSFTQNRKFLMGFCEAMGKSGLAVPWACPNGIRLDSLDSDMVLAMEGAGCYSLAVGIESGNQSSLDAMGKKITLDKIREKIALIKNNSSIRITGFFILGYPGETADHIENTIRFSLELPIDRANFFNFIPFPGSRIYEELKAGGKLDGLDYSSLYIHKISYTPDGISREELHGLQRQAHIRFYLRVKILLRLAAEVKSFYQLSTIASRAMSILFQGRKRNGD